MKLVQRIDSALFAADMALRAATEWLQTGLLFDPTRPAMRSDPYPIYRTLRERDPFHRSWPAGGFVLTRDRLDELVTIGVKETGVASKAMVHEDRAAGVCQHRSAHRECLERQERETFIRRRHDDNRCSFERLEPLPF